MKTLIPSERIERRIFLIRGYKVMLDSDLAALYEVPTKMLNKAVRRNISRFPDDFMFELSDSETKSLRFQFGTSKLGRGGRRYLPRAFTEQGVAMLSSVLRGERAVQVNIAIMRAFVKLHEVLATNKELAAKFAELERRVSGHDGKLRSHDAQIQGIFDAIKKLMEPPPPVPPTPEEPQRPIGFRP